MKHYLLPDISKPGKIGCSLPESDVPAAELPSKEMLRHELDMPEVSEVEIIRYFNEIEGIFYEKTSFRTNANRSFSVSQIRNRNTQQIHI